MLRDAAVRGVTLSRCVRDQLEAHMALEEELLHVVVKDVREQGRAAGAALRLRLLDELEVRLAATLGHQGELLAQIASDLWLAVCQLDRAYAGLVGSVLLTNVRDRDARIRQGGRALPATAGGCAAKPNNSAALRVGPPGFETGGRRKTPSKIK